MMKKTFYVKQTIKNENIAIDVRKYLNKKIYVKKIENILR